MRIRQHPESGMTRFGAVWATGLAALAFGLIAVGATPAHAAGKLEIVSLSNRPDKVSGGDVLILVRVPDGTEQRPSTGGRNQDRS